MPNKYTTKFIDASGNDLGSMQTNFIEKDYVIDSYAALSNVWKTPVLWTWGRNAYGQLGDNTTTKRSSPVQTVAGGTTWKQASCGLYFTGAIKTDGTLWMWGYNYKGQLGDNSTSQRLSPVQTVAGGTNWRQISLASGYFSAGIKTDGTLWTWGNNSSGQLGDNTSTNRSSPVQEVTAGTNWKQVSLGGNFSAGIKSDGTLWLWGGNSNGQLGDNTVVSKSSPVQTVAGGTNWIKVSCGGYSVTAIKTDGTLWAWGNNGNGQLGDNTTTKKSSPVQTVAGGTNWKTTNTNGSFSAGIKTDGTLWLWGGNFNGALGDNTTVPKSSPVQTVTGGTNWKQVAMGNNHTAAIKTDGTLWAWGNDGVGQLGDNAITQQSSPVQTVTGGTNWKSISCGNSHNAAISEAEGW